MAAAPPAAAAPAAPPAQNPSGTGAPPPGGAGRGVPPQKSDFSPVLQQLNLESIRTRTQDLFTAISSILQSFQKIPQHKWSDVLGQFSMVNVELLNLIEDIKPILRMFVVHPKNVNAENAPILPIMLSSKLLPEMEAEEAALKEQILADISSLPIQSQTEKLQRQIEMVRKACEFAEKALAENRKLYSLGSRQVPVVLMPLDKTQAAKIAEQEKLLRAGVNMGEGLRLTQNEKQHTSSLPPHIVSALQPADGGSTFQGALKVPSAAQSSAIGTLAGTPQQVVAAQILNRNALSPMPIAGGTAVDGTSASPMQYANSPRSGMDASPQQSLLQRQKVQQLQKQQHLQQQLRQPATPPIAQNQFQQLQQHHFQQQLQAQQQQQQRALQQQQQQQLQSGALQQGSQLQQSLGQSQLTQSGQVKPHISQISTNPTSSLFGNTQMPSNMMPTLGSNIQSQSSILQQRLHLGMNAGGVGMTAAGMGPGGGGINAAGVGMGSGQVQRTLSSQLITDPMYNMGHTGSQPAGNLGLPMQQQLIGQSNFNSIIGTNQNLNFGQQRQPPQSQ